MVLITKDRDGNPHSQLDFSTSFKTMVIYASFQFFGNVLLRFIEKVEMLCMSNNIAPFPSCL